MSRSRAIRSRSTCMSPMAAIRSSASSIALRVKGKALARFCRLDEGERHARETVAAMARTDATDEQAESLLALAEVLALACRDDEAALRAREAHETFVQKGNLRSASRVREAFAELAL